MWWDGFGGMGWWMMFGWLVMLAFWGGIIVLVVWGIKKLVERGSGLDITQKRDPLDIAKERYAKGDISKKEFERIKKDLS
ncbi:MAG: SHOCT domain-containing protein [Chloroflexi bacterium]|nr:SHOCT domain-containing protein [Chloroflexota bacterium]MBL7061795.1 SHOCT domain-containing protein [Dehalococcoidia bacterium]